jgi:hypothetical protein
LKPALEDLNANRPCLGREFNRVAMLRVFGASEAKIFEEFEEIGI